MNNILLVLHIVFPLWMLVLMYTPAISGVLLLVVIFTNLLLGLVYKLVQRFGKGKTVLIVFRVLAAVTVLLYYTPFAIMTHFRETKALYPIKRWVYLHGVYAGNAAFYETLFPDRLPAVCEDYSFTTMGSMVAQDYHASSYLTFHTDSAGVNAVLARMESAGYHPEYSDPDHAEDTEDKTAKHISWAAAQLRLSDAMTAEAESAALYWIGEYYPKAVLVNAQTGLVAVLT